MKFPTFKNKVIPCFRFQSFYIKSQCEFWSNCTVVNSVFSLRCKSKGVNCNKSMLSCNVMLLCNNLVLCVLEWLCYVNVKRTIILFIKSNLSFMTSLNKMLPVNVFVITTCIMIKVGGGVGKGSIPRASTCNLCFKT